MNSWVVWCFVITFGTMMPLTKSDYILAIVPLDITTHQRFTSPILRELAIKGHHVTVITPVKDPNPPPKYKEVIIPRIPLWDAVPFYDDNSSVVSASNSNLRDIQVDLRNRTLAITDIILGSDAMKDFMAKDDTRYNLILCELFHTEAFYIFSHIYKAPMVGLSSFGHAHFINQIIGNPYELSYVPHESLTLPRRFKIFDRLRNTFWTVLDLFERNWWIDSEHERLVKKHFDDLKQPTPSLRELQKNIKLVLLNTHFTVDKVRPLVPGIIEVGGLHVKNASNKLPKDIELFMEQSKYGLAYINFENDVYPSDICDKKIKLFMKAFSEMKMRFIWTWNHDYEPPKDIPENVLFIKNIPMNNILGDRRIQLFITHGGFIHIQEAVSKSIPVLCIPRFGDQFTTCSKAVHDGYAKQLVSEDLNEEIIVISILEIAEGPRFEENIKIATSQFTNRQNPPLQTAIYWIESATKEFNHIKSPIQDISWYEYYLLDTMAIIGLLLYYTFRFIVWFWFNVALRKKVIRHDIQHLIEKQKAH